MGNFTINNKTFMCPVELTLSVIGGKWKGLILWNLREGVQRYGALKKKIPGITHKMLSQSLRELEKDGIVSRKVYQVIPPMVEYTLTSRGEELKPVLQSVQQWGLSFLHSENITCTGNSTSEKKSTGHLEPEPDTVHIDN
jgi:DNA-binding HxlR family transcriptional regulator